MSNNNRNHRNSYKTESGNRGVIIALGALALVIFACLFGSAMAMMSAYRGFVGGDTQLTTGATPAASAWEADSAELTLAASPLMAPVLQGLIESFNAKELTTPDGKRMNVVILPLEPQAMVDAALAQPPFQALTPDSTLWIDRLEQRWSTALNDTMSGEIPLGQRRTVESVRYAVSPVVIAAWESVARTLGWPDKPVSWQDIQQQATEDPNFKWSHPSTGTATGLLATLAEFYAGAGLTRGLTEEAATAEETVEYVRAVESTVRFYGEGEDVVIQRLLSEGRNYLDAFVAQERVVIDWNENRGGSERLVALYPAEGSFWTDHPLALLDLGVREGEQKVTDNQRATYRALADYLTTPVAQDRLLASGYRPADLSISLDRPGSPFANSDAIDWKQPQTTLQMPAPAVIDVVLNFWYYTKRPTNVYLVVDTSGSMEGNKLKAAKVALESFIEQIQGDRDQIALIEFGNETKNFVPMTPLDNTSRAQLQETVQRMQADGGTALLDAIYEAAQDLIERQDSEAINAIVVITDGRENESYNGLREIQSLLRGTQPTPIIFTIAFGDDADEEMLTEIARIGGGQFRRATEMDLQELYKTISTYF